MHKDEVFLKEAEALHSLRALEEIEKNPQISQRELSNHLGVALGITNSLLRTLVRKGLIKIRGENNRSLTYHLTHAGALAKSKLAMQWTLNTIDYYRQARLSIANKLSDVAAQGIKTIILFGNRELVEVAVIVAPEVGLTITGIVVDETHDIARPVYGYQAIRIEQLSEMKLDAIVICQETDDGLIEKLSQYIDASTRLYYLI